MPESSRTQNRENADTRSQETSFEIQRSLERNWNHIEPIVTRAMAWPQERSTRFNRSLGFHGCPWAAAAILDIFLDRLGVARATPEELTHAFKTVSRVEIERIWLDCLHLIQERTEVFDAAAHVDASAWLFFSREAEQPRLQSHQLVTLSPDIILNHLLLELADRNRAESKEVSPPHIEVMTTDEEWMDDTMGGAETILRALCPKPFHRVVRRFAVRTQIPPSGTLTLSDGRTVEKIPAGRYEPGLRKISLATSMTTTPEEFMRTVLHEIGHAIEHHPSFSDALRIKYRFLQAVKTEPNTFSQYAALSYSSDGDITGLSEDFAESAMWYLRVPTLLYEHAPERYAAMEEIFSTYFSEVNLNEIRGTMTDLMNEYYDRLRTDPVFTSQLIETERVPVYEIMLQYPTMSNRILDYVSMHYPGVSEHVRVHEDQRITERFNKEGSIVHVMIEAPGSIAIPFFDASYNERGQLVSYSQKEGTRTLSTHLEYDGDSLIPTHATITWNGVVQQEIIYTAIEGGIQEVVISPRNARIKPQTIHYALSPQGKILSATGIADGIPLFSRRYAYDPQGNLIAKDMCTGTGRVTVPYPYAYESKTYANTTGK